MTLTVERAAERLQATPRTVRNWCQGGLFPHAYRDETERGPIWRIPEDDLARFTRPRRGPGRGPRCGHVSGPRPSVGQSGARVREHSMDERGGRPDD